MLGPFSQDYGMYSKMHLTGHNQFTNSFSGGYKTTQGWFVVDKITVRFLNH